MKKLTVLLCFLPFVMVAQIPAPMPNTYINDVTGKLSIEQIQVLNDSISSIEKKSSVQLAVIIIDNLPESMSIEDYTLEIGRKWHVGNARNGLVYVAALNQHKQRLEVADALQSKITDADALQITDNIKPFFRSGDYNGGLQILVQQISEKLNPILQEQIALAKAEQSKKNSKGFGWLWLLLLPIPAGLYFIFKPKKADKEGTPITDFGYHPSATNSGSNNNYINPVAPLIYPPTYDSGTSPSSGSSSSSSSSDSSSSYGSWGSGSSDSGSSSFDSGFSGGGASNDW